MVAEVPKTCGENEPSICEIVKKEKAFHVNVPRAGDHTHIT